MKIRYGTKNIAKVEHMKSLVNGLDLEISGMDSDVVDIDEKGLTIKENAKLKALHYYKQVKEPVFSCDSGLYFDHLNDADQPGLFIRRVDGHRLSDDQMIDHYSEIAKNNGGEAICRYRNAICLVMSEKEIYEYDGLDISSEPFKIIEKPHIKRIEGFPIDSLSVDISSNKYYFDIDDESSKEKMSRGFKDFFKRSRNEK